VSTPGKETEARASLRVGDSDRASGGGIGRLQEGARDRQTFQAGCRFGGTA